jgi:uncharacterized protein YrrD
MKTSFNEFSEFAVHARDGEIGRIKDFYFDDVSWRLRYLVVDTRKWLGGRLALLSPQAVESLNLTRRELRLTLDRAQVEAAPALDEHVPLNRQSLTDLDLHYGWNHYWITGGPLSLNFQTINYGPIGETEVPEDVRVMLEARRARGDDTLVSVKDLLGWHVESVDDDRAGTVRDAIVNYMNWTVPYLVIDTGHWIPGRKVILPSSFVETFDLDRRAIAVRVSAESIATAPEFDLDRLDERCERTLVDHYFDRMEPGWIHQTRDERRDGSVGAGEADEAKDETGRDQHI